MQKQVQSDAGTPVVVTSRESGSRIYFSTDISKGQACWDKNRREWVPVKKEFGHAFKGRIAQAFEL